MDMEESVLNFVQTKPYGNLFPTQNIICGIEGSANQFMNGYYSQIAKHNASMAMDVIRMESEKSDCLQGISSKFIFGSYFFVIFLVTTLLCHYSLKKIYILVE